MKLIVLVALACLAVCTARSIGDLGSDVGIGLGLPFLGKIKLDLGTGLGFDEGLFGLGKMMIGKRIGLMVLKNVNGRNAAGGKAGKEQVKDNSALLKKYRQSLGRASSDNGVMQPKIRPK